MHTLTLTLTLYIYHLFLSFVPSHKTLSLSPVLFLSLSSQQPQPTLYSLSLSLSLSPVLSLFLSLSSRSQPQPQNPLTHVSLSFGLTPSPVLPLSLFSLLSSKPTTRTPLSLSRALTLSLSFVPRPTNHAALSLSFVPRPANPPLSFVPSHPTHTAPPPSLPRFVSAVNTAPTTTAPSHPHLLTHAALLVAASSSLPAPQPITRQHHTDHLHRLSPSTRLTRRSPLFPACRQHPPTPINSARLSQNPQHLPARTPPPAHLHLPSSAPSTPPHPSTALPPRQQPQTACQRRPLPPRMTTNPHATPDTNQISPRYPSPPLVSSSLPLAATVCSPSPQPRSAADSLVGKILYPFHSYFIFLD